MARYKKTEILLFSIFILALIIRLIAANHSDVGTDELPHAVRAIDIIEAGRLSSLDQVPLYLYLTDISYKIFGINGLSVRFTNILFGSLSTILIFLIGKEIFNKKTALIASFLFSISVYATIFNYEPDMLGVFFVLFSIYYYIKGLKYKEYYFITSALFLGLGILSKNVAAFILPAYAIFYFIYHHKSEKNSLLNFKEGKIKFSKKTLKLILIAGLVLLITISPIIVFNYLLYKDRGITDLIVSRSLHLDLELYENFFGGLRDYSFTLDWEVTKVVIEKIFKFDGLIATLAVIGMFFTLRDKKNPWKWFLFLSIIFPLFLLTGSAGASETHYLFIIPMIVLFAAYGIFFISKKFKSEHVIISLLAIILIFNLFIMSQNIYEPSGMVEMRKITQDFEKNSLVIADSRIWNGRIAWLLNDKHYLESNYFPEILNKINEFPGTPVSMPTYFIECINDDCGWGRSIKDNKNLQEQTENIVNLFKNNGQLINTIKGKQFSFNVYKTDLTLKESIFPTVDGTHQFFMNSVGWKEMEKMPDYYEINGLIDKTLNLIAHLSLWIGIIIALLTPFYIIHLIKKEI